VSGCLRGIDVSDKDAQRRRSQDCIKAEDTARAREGRRGTACISATDHEKDAAASRNHIDIRPFPLQTDLPSRLDLELLTKVSGSEPAVTGRTASLARIYWHFSVFTVSRKPQQFISGVLWNCTCGAVGGL
jgi:hypothetical protein